RRIARPRSLHRRRRGGAHALRRPRRSAVPHARQRRAPAGRGAGMSATVFDTPLDARSLIEASAGTGKTYALAGLFARAVIVERLAVPQILAVTYTVAATQELHERVRLRLQRAAKIADVWQEGQAPEQA